MLIYGASGHAKVIIESLEKQGVEILGIFDDDEQKKKIFEYNVIGEYDNSKYSNSKLIIAIGDNLIRSKIACKVKHDFGILIDKSSILSKRVIVAQGTVLLQGCIIQAGTTIGEHCIINTKSSIDHDCTISDFVHIAPGVTLCGGISIGEGSLIGAGSTILPNLKIGKWCQIGAGAVVTSDVEDYCKIKGNPAK